MIRPAVANHGQNLDDIVQVSEKALGVRNFRKKSICQL